MADLESTIKSFVNAAVSCGWDVDYGDPIDLPDAVGQRFACIPDESVAFLSRVRRCKHPDELKWFVCVEDYRPARDDEYTWQNMEEILSDAADDTEIEEIKRFWDSMFPVAYAPWPDFAYLGISLSKKDFGAVYYGFSPYWEEPSRVADSLQDYLTQMTAYLNGTENTHYVDENGQECVAREFDDFLLSS